MDVTHENFLKLLPEITQAIEQCDFIGFDTELSGLLRERCVNRFDLPCERFGKAVESSRGYFIMQFGLSCFKQSQELHYSNKTYNFYIFPQPNGTYGDINRTFSIQAHAIQFLSEHGFDFNRLFKYGLSYLTFQEKKSMTAKLKQEHKARLKAEREGQQKKSPKLVVVDKDEQKKNANIEREEQEKALVLSKGFLEILELIIINKKPLVGHNIALDLIQIINQFMEPLTDSYTSFKEICHSLFPLIYDTKYIAHAILEPETLTNNQSRLNDLYCQLRNTDGFPKVIVDNLDELFESDQMPHQAGYDAFMSGYCYIVLCESYLRETSNKKTKNLSDTKELIANNQTVISEFSNKIHLSYSYDFKCFNLSEDEEEPDRSHVFYLEFPKSWELDDILGVFRKFKVGVTVARITKTTALCALRDRKLAEKVSKKVTSHKDPNYKLYTYDFYVENLKPNTKKEIDGGSADAIMLEV